MRDLPDDVERGVLGEHLSHKLDVLTEGMTSLLKDVPEIKTKVGAIDERLTRVEDKLDVVADAVKDHIADKKPAPIAGPALTLRGWQLVDGRGGGEELVLAPCTSEGVLTAVGGDSRFRSRLGIWQLHGHEPALAGCDGTASRVDAAMAGCPIDRYLGFAHWLDRAATSAI